MRVTAIIVTYANRFHFLEQVLMACLVQKVNNIVVVNNNADASSKEKLEEFAKVNQKIDIITNKENLGSARAFKQGLLFAKKLPNDFIFLLDDDNKPKNHCLHMLKENYISDSNKTDVLLCYRQDRSQYKSSIQQEKPYLVLGAKNSFSGFHLFNKIKSLFVKKASSNHFIKTGQVACAPYGGMFFHKQSLTEVGYPNEDYFLYADDHDWSYRFTKKGHKIRLILDAEIIDLDTSWAIKESKSIFKNSKNAPHFRVYYSFRNRILFEKENLVSNKYIYKINQYLFTFLMFVYNARNKVFKVYLRAIKDAKNNNLSRF